MRLLPLLIALAMLFCSHAQANRSTQLLSGTGWNMWHDVEATWAEDELFLPPVDLKKLPVHLPTGGWEALTTTGQAVAVPGTVEEYLQDGKGPESDLKGVSWWWRTFRVPDTAKNQRVRLQFDSVRHRAEIFVNRQLVGYDVIGNTPFEVDITDVVKAGEDCELSVRITDPGGNFDWKDSAPFQWGKYTIPMSHGFGGITGRVRLVACAPVYVEDIYVQNTPEPRRVKVFATIRNTTSEAATRDVFVRLFPDGGDAHAIATQMQRQVQIEPGVKMVACEIEAPKAELWDLEHPRLHSCMVELEEPQKVTDTYSQSFGFRSFAPEGIGKDAVFRLNGKRIFLRTAISWGFWPINGIFPTPELAEKEIRTAKALGQNMLNFHRCIGHPISFEKADELGLLIYEEPGGYGSARGDAFAQALAREKLLRMVKRDRSHPSLVIYNMINEAGNIGMDDPHLALNDPLLKVRARDMRDAHALDPSRTITHTSAWARSPEDSSKMHMRPFDDAVHLRGWFDFHHAGGPEVWKQDLYKDPKSFYGRTENTDEIVYWGEEGAISTPPRLEKINADLKDAPHLGWDGAVYREWFKTFDDFLTQKNLREAFPTVDALTTALGAISLEHQARKIEQHRICNANDGYAVNGWEAQIIENHSGIVDCFRNPKADPEIMAARAQPLSAVVKLRSEFVQVPGEVLADFYVINEAKITGPHTLNVRVSAPNGETLFTKELPVTLSGGETYGELLAAGEKIPISDHTGVLKIQARVTKAGGQFSTPYGPPDEVLAMDWRSAKLGGKGAVWETGKRVASFLKDRKQLEVPVYRDDTPKLDWVVVARPPDEGAMTSVPPERLRDPSGKIGGLAATFFRGSSFEEKLHERVDPSVDLVVPDGATPDPAVPLTSGYCVRWQGELLPPATGRYGFTVRSDGGVRLTVNGKPLIDAIKERSTQTFRGAIDLKADKPVPITFEFVQQRQSARCVLTWAVPEKDPPDPQRLLERVRDDGTTLLLLDRADGWLDLIQKNSAAKFAGTFKIGTAWLGGDHFVRAHPLFKDLPVNVGMNWPYQALVRDGRTRYGIVAEGEELVAGAWHCYPMQLGTAVGIVPCGKGRIVFSTLDICDNLANAAPPAEVARKLLCNFLEYAASPPGN